jgi:hypothetical protein
LRDFDALVAAMCSQGKGIMSTELRPWEQIKADIPGDITVHNFLMGSKKMVWVEFDMSGCLPSPASEKNAAGADRLQKDLPTLPQHP